VVAKGRCPPTDSQAPRDAEAHARISIIAPNLGGARNNVGRRYCFLTVGRSRGGSAVNGPGGVELNAPKG
jgi:hypothetical protein